LGNLYEEVSDATARATVEAVVAEGIRYIDTAPHYGLGLSEVRLGAALADHPRESYVISTKVGRSLEPNPGYRPGMVDTEGFAVPRTSVRRWDPTERGIRACLEASLTRLGIDAVDIAYVHDPECYDVDAAIDQALPALARLRDEGVVRAIGVGSGSVAALTRCVRECDLDLIMLAGRYTLLDQSAAAELLPLCLRRGTGVVAVGIFNSGVLARAEVPDTATYDYAPASAPVIERARGLARVCERYGVDLPTAALQFPLRHEAVRMVLVGANRPSYVHEAARRMASEVPGELWGQLGMEGSCP
jgi:D-threo-aldose 1-dehydrogenase